MPNDPSQIIYVWLDALVNYLTVAGYPDDTEKLKKLWPADVHIVGKDIIKFHAIYWPAFLFAAGLEPPKRILCHGHWLMDNKKMSKSVGNVVDPFELRKKFTTDGVRYILIRDGVPTTDNNISLETALNVINAELSNTFGNLFQRCAAKAINPNQVYPSYDEIEMFLNEENKIFIEKLNGLRSCCDELYEKFSFYEGIHKIMSVLRDMNLLVQETKPWILVKDKNEKSLNELKKLFYLSFETLRICSILLNPIIPNITKKSLSYLGVSENECRYINAVLDRQKYENRKINVANQDVLFKRLI